MIGIENVSNEALATVAGEVNEPLLTELTSNADGAESGNADSQKESRDGGGELRGSPDTVARRNGTGKKSSTLGPAKQDIILQKLRTAKGATLEALVEATGWQPHSVRGFLSGTVKKKLGLALTSDIGKDGKRRYRISRQAAA